MTRRSLMIGIARLGRFRADGLDHFEGTVQAYLNSLAPLLGFALVGALLMLLHGNWLVALTDLLSTIIVLLAPGVISEPLARYWDREAAWTKFAVVMNWCQWTVPIVFLLSLLMSGLLMAAGWPQDRAMLLAAGCVVLYGLSLHWFLSRRALGLSRGRSVLLVLLMNLGTGMLAIGPRLLAGGAFEA